MIYSESITRNCISTVKYSQDKRNDQRANLSASNFSRTVLAPEAIVWGDIDVRAEYLLRSPRSHETIHCPSKTF